MSDEDKKEEVVEEVSTAKQEEATPAEKPAVADEASAEKKSSAVNPVDRILNVEEPEAPVVAHKGGRRGSRVPPVGIVHIKSTFNNTLVSITDVRGNVISWSNAGRSGFKGSRKNTAFAATVVGQDAARQAVAKGMHEVEVRVQGAGAGRESAIRAVQSSGLVITAIKDITPIAHNGCRMKKRRRV
ncbi:MAG: 30S ribosomal protein S11 [Kiritimatiellae bacterium]|nr:30S ribosomal protein S11 [Kiritimatiellia bacterium]